jgi:Flp pilus assembly protein TadG
MNRRARQRGQTVVEFALIAPIVFLLLFVIVDFGIAMDRRIVLQDAVREGARYAAVTDDLNLIKDRTVAHAQDIIDTSHVRVCYTDMNDPPNGSSTDAGDAVDVCVNFTYDPFMIRPFDHTIGTIPMNVTGSSRLEQSAQASSDSGCPCP